MTKYFVIINFLFLIILNKSKLGLCDDECEGAFYIPSVSKPTDEIILSVNETLIVNCRILTIANYCHSSYLSFQTNDGRDLSNKVKKLDNTTIQLFIPNMKEFNSVYNCIYKNEAMNRKYGLGQIAVQVAYKPEITNLSCISINLDNMECTINLISSPLETDYNIQYGPTVNDHETSSRIIVKKNVSRERSKIVFPIETFTRAMYLFYYFQIDLHNTLGAYSKTYWVEISRIAKPVIRSLLVTELTSESVILVWSIPPIFSFLDTKFKHQVIICQQNCTENPSESWRYIDTNKTKELNQTTFQLKINLDYAYTWYDIRVSTSVRDALYHDLWSYANGTIFQTSKRKPDKPPDVAVGGFEILPNNEMKIYWKETPRIKWNANSTTYEILELIGNGERMSVQPEYNYSNTTAKFYGLQHKESDYQFKIISRNSEGRSGGYSVINIPRKSKRIPAPNHLIKLLSNSIYTLTWNYSNDLIPDNFTIFWCDPVDEQGTLCDKLLDFAYVNTNEKNTFIYNNTHDKKTKIFAISSNRADQTSGMKWFPCSVTENQDMTLFPANLEVIGATQMNISWSTQCATPLLKGFNISYCPISNPNLTECNETMLYVDASNSFHIIENLLAYTTYLVKISMFNGKKSGPIVELRKVTDSCQPTVPHDLSYEQITNSSITLKWSPPDYWNGEPNSYNISYKLINNTNHQYHEYYKSVEILNDGCLPNGFKLENLRSFSDYIIEVAGCNPACSNFSNEIKIKTLIGKPDQIHNFIKSENPVSYSWEPPWYKAGHLDFYEILFEVKVGIEYQVIRKIQLNSTRCTPVNKLCNQENRDFKISVRALNIVKGVVFNMDEVENNTTNNNKHHLFDKIKCQEESAHVSFKCGKNDICIAGDWQMGFMPECGFDPDTFSKITVACFCIGLGMLIGLTMVCKKVRQIKDVGIPELPEGMEGIMETKPPLNNIIMHNSKQNGNLEDEQKARLISESKSIEDYRIYMDNSHFDGDNDNLPITYLSNKQSATNFLNLTKTDLENPYGCETEAKPIMNYISDRNSNYDYDGDSIYHSETVSYGSTQSINDSTNMQSVATENTNTESNYVAQLPPLSTTNSPLIMSNGYVRVSDILKPKPPVSNGYVSIADLPNQNFTIVTKPKLANNDILWAENGYVKPKHLVEFEGNRGTT